MRNRRIALTASSVVAAATLSLAWGCNDTPTQVVTHEAAAISISAAVDHVHTGLTGSFVATVTCRHGDVMPVPVTWSVDDPAIASVDSDGILTGLTIGSTIVNAAVGGVSASASIKVLASVVAIELAPDDSRIYLAESIQFTTVLLDEDGAVLDRAVRWASSNELVASVDVDGLGTGLSAGDVVISAESEGVTASVGLTVLAPVAELQIEPAELTLYVHDQAQFRARIRDQDGKEVTRATAWSSSDEAVLTVDADGLVTAASKGVATIVAESESVSGSAEVTVIMPVASVEVKPSTATLIAGETLKLEVVLSDENGEELHRPVAYTSDAPGIAAVSREGLVMAVAVGMATIEVESEGEVGVATIMVVPPVAGVEVTPEAATRKPGETLQLTATLVDKDGALLDRPVTWASADEALATVDDTGLVTAVEVGEVEISATAEGRSDSALLTVIPHVDRVEVSPNEASMPIGASRSFSAKAFDVNGAELDRPIEWDSEDTGIATVDDKGLVTALAVGGTTVSATVDGVVGSATITVLVPVDRVVVTDPGMEPLEVGLTLQLEAIVYDATGGVLDRPIEWNSDLPNIAEVDEFGLVTGQGRGTAIITASSEGKSASVQVRVVGEDTEAGNNLSYPVVFAEGIGLSGAEVSDPMGDPVYANTGLRPGDAEGITVDALPFFYEGNATDYGAYYEQQGANVWQAEWADGTLIGSRSVEAGWGDNLTHQTWDTHAMIRVEMVLTDLGIGTLDGFNMSYLYGTGPDEMQGTDGSVGAFVPTVYAVTPRLIIEKLDDDGQAVVEEVFNGAIWEGAGSDGPGSFSAEVNVAGKIIYGYNFFIRNIELAAENHKFGWWRLTFALDPQATIGTTQVPRNLSIGVVTGEGDGELTYQPVLASDGFSTWLDIYVEKGSN
jgi:uncharacterized protein YjdB